MAPPQWALLERQLLKAQSDACTASFERYFVAGLSREVDRLSLPKPYL